MDLDKRERFIDLYSCWHTITHYTSGILVQFEIIKALTTFIFNDFNLRNYLRTLSSFFLDILLSFSASQETFFEQLKMHYFNTISFRNS